MDDIIKVVESLEKSGLLIDDDIETVKCEIKKQEDGLFDAIMVPMAAALTAPIDSSLMQPVPSSLINVVTVKGQEGVFRPLIALNLMMKKSYIYKRSFEGCKNI